MEYVHGDHLQLSDAFALANRPGRPGRQPREREVLGSVVLAVRGGGAELAQSAVLDLPHPLARQADPLADVTQ